MSRCGLAANLLCSSACGSVVTDAPPLPTPGAPLLGRDGQPPLPGWHGDLPAADLPHRSLYSSSATSNVMPLPAPTAELPAGSDDLPRLHGRHGALPAPQHSVTAAGSADVSPVRPWRMALTPFALSTSAAPSLVGTTHGSGADAEGGSGTKDGNALAPTPTDEQALAVLHTDQQALAALAALQMGDVVLATPLRRCMAGDNEVGALSQGPSAASDMPESAPEITSSCGALAAPRADELALHTRAAKDNDIGALHQLPSAAATPDTSEAAPKTTSLAANTPAPHTPAPRAFTPHTPANRTPAVRALAVHAFLSPARVVTPHNSAVSLRRKGAKTPKAPPRRQTTLPKHGTAVAGPDTSSLPPRQGMAASATTAANASSTPPPLVMAKLASDAYGTRTPRLMRWTPRRAAGGRAAGGRAAAPLVVSGIAQQATTSAAAGRAPRSTLTAWLRAFAGAVSPALTPARHSSRKQPSPGKKRARQKGCGTPTRAVATPPCSSPPFPRCDASPPSDDQCSNCEGVDSGVTTPSSAVA
eukprot:NODE_3427_length_2038_cov_3.136578.p1 GENE.NODE_3427_length_2038_cov_3.136578~~NODE_3427_length_2038_cov_3.136578.p1  ORF type:complete len:602 (-),score=65.57 NODE_3427_length_2038_cov_3.136578:233-1825(-)